MAVGRRGLGEGLPQWRLKAAEALTVVSVVALVFRIPGALFLVLGGAALQLLLLTWTPLARRARPWVATLLAAVLASLGALITRTAPPEPVNFATITISFLLVTLALTATTHGPRLAQVLMTALYWSFVGMLLIGLGELATGFRLITILYPDTKLPETASPFEVSAIYPNYNDFSVVMAMLVTMALVRALFDRCGMVHRWLRLGLVTGVCLLIFVQGSRGALAAVLVAGALVLWLKLRTEASGRILTAVTFCAMLLALGLGAFVWASPWVQDSSTRIRGGIVEKVLGMTPDVSLEFWLGYGSEGAYDAATKDHYPGLLMDPHNVVLETFIWYGLPVTLVFVAFWLSVVYQGVWRMRVALDWRAISPVVLVSLLPILGVVPSSTYRYYFIFLLSAAAAVALSSWRPACRDA